MPDLRVAPVAFTGGLQDSKASPEPSDLQELSNFALFRGRFALRAPVQETVRLVDDAVTPAEITQVLAGAFHNGKFYVVGHSSNEDKTYLYRLEVDGQAESGDSEFPKASPVATVWTGSSVPRVSLASFQGGSATAGVNRLYIANYRDPGSLQYVTRVWNSDSSSISNLTADWDAAGTEEDALFHLVFVHQFHIFGAGFLQTNAGPSYVLRPELLRFSRPGAIPADEPGSSSTGQEWWSVDHRSFGQRGDKITAVGFAGGNAVVFKRRETHVLFGYDASSWATRRISDRVGAVGPQAWASTPDGLCYFWSERGPHLTDGQQVVDLGEDIRQRVVDAGFNEDVSVEYSADDGLVYFVVADQGATAPNHALAFDRVRQRWMETDWLNTSGVSFLVNDLTAIPDESSPGPAQAPSNVTIAVASDTQLDLSWINGDTSIDTVTEIHRSTTSGFTISKTTLAATRSAGVTAYSDTGRTAETQYYYKIRHVRNEQTADSPEATATTAVASLTGFTAGSLGTGVRLSFTNNSSSADIDIERRPTAGGGYTVIDTLLSQSTGAKTYDDTAATCGTDYTYRARAKKTNFVSSPYTPEANKVACSTAPALVTAKHTLTVETECPVSNNLVITWSGTNFDPDDRAKVYKNVDGAGFVLLADVALQSGSYVDKQPWKSGAVMKSFQIRVEAWDGGTVLSDTEDSTSANYSVDPNDCPE